MPHCVGHSSLGPIDPLSKMLQRSWLEQRLLGIWFQGQRAPWWLLLLTPIYRALAKAHRWWARYRSSHPGVPVIVVGNVAVGGTGKSPVVMAIVEYLRDAGWRPGVVTRGYGGTVRHSTLVDEASDPTEVGDEPLMIFQRTKIPVAVGRDRAASAAALLTQDVDVIVSDDGLQHWRLGRDMELAVVDGERLHGNGRLLPLGPLREPVSRLNEVDWVLQNGGETSHENWHPMQLHGRTAVRLDTGEERPLEAFAGCVIEAIAGIGNPARFFAVLAGAGLDVSSTAFSDHHAYSADDLGCYRSKTLLMTEKDAVKCRRYADGKDWWFLPVRAKLSERFWAAFARRLERLRKAET